jgi:hypothetical protein
VLDYDRFVQGRPPQSGFLTVLEEVPGLIHYEDMTAHLLVSIREMGEVRIEEEGGREREEEKIDCRPFASSLPFFSSLLFSTVMNQETSYWASYNNPFFADIAALSGNAALCAQFPETACHETDPRAQIFRQRQASVVGVASLQALLTYNDFRHDPLSRNDSCNVSSSSSFVLQQALFCSSPPPPPLFYPLLLLLPLIFLSSYPLPPPPPPPISHILSLLPLISSSSSFLPSPPILLLLLSLISSSPPPSSHLPLLLLPLLLLLSLISSPSSYLSSPPLLSSSLERP